MTSGKSDTLISKLPHKEKTMENEQTHKKRSVQNSKRTLYFDYMRVCATFAVIMIHVTAQYFHDLEPSSFAWKTINAYQCLSRWGVPVFVMMSGALFLTREIPLQKIYSKYVHRLFTCFIFWSIVYALEAAIFHQSDFILHALKGNYHLWYIWMIIGLYICIPFLNPIVADEGKMRYFLLLSFIFTYLLPAIHQLSKDFASEYVQSLVNAVHTNVDRIRMDMVLGYTGCFILGYYLYTHRLRKIHRICTSVLGLIGIVSMYMLSLALALKKEPDSAYYNPLTLCALLMSVAVFVLFKYHRFKPNRLTPLLFKLSKYSFGAYLVHPLILTSLERVGFDSLTFGNPVLSIACVFAVVTVIAFGISAILNSIPVVGKYIV